MVILLMDYFTSSVYYSFLSYHTVLSIITYFKCILSRNYDMKITEGPEGAWPGAEKIQEHIK